MVKEQSPRQLLNVRTMVYELLTHCIPAEIIIRRMAESVLQKVCFELGSGSWSVCLYVCLSWYVCLSVCLFVFLSVSVCDI